MDRKNARTDGRSALDQACESVDASFIKFGTALPHQRAWPAVGLQWDADRLHNFAQNIFRAFGFFL